MRRALARTRMVALLGTALAALPAFAQHPAAPSASAIPSSPDVFAIEQLDAMLAPIALYPDPVLAPLLMAASDPLPAVMAARWAAQPEHAKLTGDALVAALADRDWDPDVKLLTAFPGVLAMLNAHLDWTMQLGYAVANQTDAVLDSIQRLRRQAIADGTLAGTDQTTVQHAGATVVIAPVSPDAVAIPAYDPAAAYGPWPYAAVPPVHLDAKPEETAAVPGALRNLVGIAWDHGAIVVNVKNWNAVNGDRPPVSLSVWHPRAVYAVAGRVDVGLDARPLPPTGPVGRPARPSGIPADAIGRMIVTVPARLVRSPAAAATHIAGIAPHAPAPVLIPPRPLAAGQPMSIHLAPLPARMETVRATALDDVTAGARATLFGARGAQSRGAPDAEPHAQNVARLTP